MITKTSPANVAFVGCGNISNNYARSVKTRPDLARIYGATDIDPVRAERFTGAHGGRAFRSLATVLADPQVVSC